MESTEKPTEQPVTFRIGKGNPSPSDIAVLTAIFAAASGDKEPENLSRNDWGNLHDRLRQPLENRTSFRNVGYY